MGVTIIKRVELIMLDRQLNSNVEKHTFLLCLTFYLGFAIYISSGVFDPQMAATKFKAQSLLAEPKFLFVLSCFIFCWFIFSFVYVLVTLETKLILCFDKKVISISRFFLKNITLTFDIGDVTLIKHANRKDVFALSVKSKQEMKPVYESKDFYWEITQNSDLERCLRILVNNVKLKRDTGTG
jgi:hypothetical protein